MSILVHKYGGSSLSTIDKLKAVAKKVAETKAAGYDIVVVVSAMGNTTNDLLEQAHQVTQQPSRRELDMLLSVGERISMALLSMAIHNHGYEATSLTGSQCGIITTDSHSHARIIDVRPFRVQDELANGKIVIVAGYQGTSYRRDVTTLGRGGSDTTAVALAAALGAECHIYSDVDGIFSADPRIVVDAEKLISISYDEMRELARAGARVLNEDAVAFAKKSKIALYAKSTHLKDSTGTIVRPDGFDAFCAKAEEMRPEVAVAHQEKGILITGEIDHLVAATEDERSVASGIDYSSGVAWNYIDTTDTHDLTDLMSKMEKAGLTISTDMAAVSVVGDGVGGKLRWYQEATSQLREVGISPNYVSVQLSRITFVVEREECRKAVATLAKRMSE